MPWRNDATPRNTMKPNATKSANLDGKAGVLHGVHMGGHSDVANPLTKLTASNLDKSVLDARRKVVASDITVNGKFTSLDKPKK